jgi:glycosyltransferase involved in cell wall biosynthesis
MSSRSMIFDGQVFQSAAWDRGMGKYSLSLLGAMTKDSKYNYQATYIVFTEKLKLDEAAKKAILEAAPSAELVFLDLDVPNIHDHRTIEPNMKRNRKILNNFIEQLNGPVSDKDFVILSLFIDQVCSVFPDDVRKILLFYDLIPLQYSERYGLFHSYDNYLRRFKVILEANIIWTISQTVADDLMVYTGIDAKKLININGAPIHRGHQKPEKPSNIDIPEKFVLMPSGNDLRKNNDRAVDSIKIYNSLHPDEKITLIITSFFDEETRENLRRRSSDILFTGNVSEGGLRWLYENTAAVLFVPEYEGLGLPILEGIEVNKPVICSNLTVFNEMSSTAFYYADQFSPSSISRAIDEAINLVDLKLKQKEYPKILKRYTWEESSRVALTSLEEGSSKNEEVKQSLAIFLPDPSSYSAIGKFNMYLHPTLSEYYDIDYYIEKGVGGKPPVRPSYLPAIANVYSAKTFNAKKYRDYDAVIYHVGNSEFHLDTIKNALYLPGVAIMHDIHLAPIFEGELVNRSYISKDRLLAENKLNTLVHTKDTSYTTSIVSAQLSVVAHSEHSQKALTKVAPKDVSIHRAQLPVATPILKKNKISDRISIGFAGIIHPAKGLSILDDIHESGMFDNTDIYIFGIPLMSDVELEKIGSMHNVTILTNLTDFQFQSKLADIDVLVNYRPQYNGEASASTLEAMRLGVVPIVRKIGWYDELPDDAVVKVDDQVDIISALYDLCIDNTRRERMSGNCRRVTNEDFTYDAYARNLHHFISKAIKENTSNRNISKLIQKGDSLPVIIEAINKSL